MNTDITSMQNYHAESLLINLHSNVWFYQVNNRLNTAVPPALAKNNMNFFWFAYSMSIYYIVLSPIVGIDLDIETEVSLLSSANYLSIVSHTEQTLVAL